MAPGRLGVTALGDRFETGPYPMFAILEALAWWQGRKIRSETPVFHATPGCRHAGRRVIHPVPSTVREVIKAGAVPCSCVAYAAGPVGYASLRWPTVRDAARA